MPRPNFGGAQIDVRGYVNHIGDRRQAGQAEALDILIGWTLPPRKNETQGKRQTVKGTVWNVSANRDDIGMFLKFVKKGDQISVSGPVELDTYDKKDGTTESMMKMQIDVYTPAGRDPDAPAATPTAGTKAKATPKVATNGGGAVAVAEAPDLGEDDDSAPF